MVEYAIGSMNNQERAIYLNDVSLRRRAMPWWSTH